MVRPAFFVTSALAVAALGFQMSTAHASHSWSNYHWKRTTGPVPFVLGHNLTDEKWDVEPGDTTGTFLQQAKDDWTTENEINITGMDGDVGTYSSNDADKCEIPNDDIGVFDGVIDVCSRKYGSNG